MDGVPLQERGKGGAGAGVMFEDEVERLRGFG